MLAGTRQRQPTAAHLPADEREFGAYAAMLHGGRSFDSLLKEIAMTGQMARAVRFDRYGGRDVLYVADVEIPSPDPGEVVVEVRAAGINPGEAGIRVRAMQEMVPATFPSCEGSVLAGVVTAVALDVTGCSVADELLGCSFRRYSHATHTAVPVGQLTRKPPELSWE